MDPPLSRPGLRRFSPQAGFAEAILGISRRHRQAVRLGRAPAAARAAAVERCAAARACQPARGRWIGLHHAIMPWAARSWDRVLAGNFFRVMAARRARRALAGSSISFDEAS